MKRNTVKVIAGLVAGGGMFLTTQAAEPGPYLTFDAGANWVPDFEVSFETAGEEDETDVDLETGFRGGLAFGYNFSRFFGAELETGFVYNEGKDADAWLGQVPFLANLVFRHENPSRIVPFIGVGAGGVAAILDLEEGDADESDSDIVPAWQAKAGMRFNLSDRASLGVAYKYLGVNSPEFSLGDSDQDFDIIHNHAVVAMFNLSF
jgi:opacity protein-like surface antigen